MGSIQCSVKYLSPSHVNIYQNPDANSHTVFPSITSPVKFCRMVSKVSFSPDGKILATTNSHDNIVQQWNPDNALEVRTGFTMQGAYNVAFSPDGQLLASSSISGGGTVWDLSTGKERFSFQNDKGQFPRFTHLISDGDFVNGMTSSNDKGQDMWSLSAYPGRKELSAISTSYSSDSKLFAHTTFNNTIRLFDTATGKSCGILRGHYEFVKAIAFSPQGRLLASGSFDHAVRVWGSA